MFKIGVYYDGDRKIKKFIINETYYIGFQKFFLNGFNLFFQISFFFFLLYNNLT